MSFVNDFIHNVKTGRLFSGYKKTEEEFRQQISELKSTINSLEEKAKVIPDLKTKIEVIDTIDKGVKKLEDKVIVIDDISKGIQKLESKVEVIDGLDKDIMKLETKVEVLSENNIEKHQSSNDTNIQPDVKRQIGPDVVIHFVFMGNKYVVEKFNMNFRQDVSEYKNRPDSFTYGGCINVTLSGFLDPSLDEWFSQTYSTRDGEIYFFPNMPKITDSSLLTIFFKDAYCTACKKELDVETSGVLTTFTISPRRIKIGNEDFENKWKEREVYPFNIKSV